MDTLDLSAIEYIKEKYNIKDYNVSNIDDQEFLEKLASDFMEFFHKKMGSVSVIKMWYMIIKTVLLYLPFAIVIYGILLFDKFIIFRDRYELIGTLLIPSFSRIFFALGVYALITFTISVLTNSIDFVWKKLQNMDNMSSIKKYGIFLFSVFLLPYATLGLLIPTYGKPDIRKMSVLYKAHKGDSPSREFTLFSQELFESGKYTIISATTQKEITRKDFEKALNYQIDLSTPTSPALLKTVYFVSSKNDKDNVSFVVFSIEQKIRYDSKERFIEKHSAYRIKRMNEEIVKTRLQYYLIISEIASKRSIMAEILSNISKMELENKTKERSTLKERH